MEGNDGPASTSSSDESLKDVLQTVVHTSHTPSIVVAIVQIMFGNSNVIMVLVGSGGHGSDIFFVHQYSMNQFEADYCLSCDIKRRGEGGQNLMSNDVKLSENTWNALKENQ